MNVPSLAVGTGNAVMKMSAGRILEKIVLTITVRLLMQTGGIFFQKQ